MSSGPFTLDDQTVSAESCFFVSSFLVLFCLVLSGEVLICVIVLFWWFLVLLFCSFDHPWLLAAGLACTGVFLVFLSVLCFIHPCLVLYPLACLLSSCIVSYSGVRVFFVCAACNNARRLLGWGVEAIRPSGIFPFVSCSFVGIYRQLTLWIFLSLCFSFIFYRYRSFEKRKRKKNITVFTTFYLMERKVENPICLSRTDGRMTPIIRKP